MKLVVGLGNPGAKYETTRHNAGFLMLDILAEDYKISWGGNKFDAEHAKGTIMGEACLLLKPQTFMNVSGKSVAQAMRFYKIPHEDLIVLHDDIDLELGKIKAREGGGHGGHNGIRDIIAATGKAEFHRIKLGVGRPKGEKAENMQVSSWVLGNMTDEELIMLQNEMCEDVKLRIKGIFER